MRHLKAAAACLLALPLLHCAGKAKFEPAKVDLFAELQGKQRKLNEKGVAAEVAIGESRDLQTGIDKAELQARARLTRSLEAKTSSLQKKFREEVGRQESEHFSEAVKSVSDQVLRGASMRETRFEKNGEGMYRVYALMVLDSDLYMKALAGELEADKATRDRFRASKAYKELNEEVRAFEAWKAEETATRNPQGS